MRKIVTLLFYVLFASVALADDCELLNYRLEGRWFYVQSGATHTLEFIKETNYLSQDGVQKEYISCNNIRPIKRFEVMLRGNDEKLFFDFSETQGNYDRARIEIGLEKFDLVKKLPLKMQIQPNDYQADSANQSWVTEIGFDGHIFPSLIIATARWSNEDFQARFMKLNNEAEYLGDLNSPLKVTLKNFPSDSNIRIEVSFGLLSEKSVWEGSLAHANKIYVIKPRVGFDYQKLLDIKQPVPMDAKVVLYVNDTKVGEKNQVITVRSINDVPLYTLDGKGLIQNDYGFLMTAFVNENNPMIDLLLRDAINTEVVDSFSGYQRGTEDVYRQVYAIWNILQRNGMKYSSITTPTGYSKKVFSQYIRFFDDAAATSQANCIDGTVMIASILRRIGINSKIILVPGHAFLGFSLDGTGRKIAFLETTVMGLVNLDQYSEKRRLRDILFESKTKNQVSYESFLYALDEGRKKYNININGLYYKKIGYKIIDIDDARKDGIVSINK